LYNNYYARWTCGVQYNIQWGRKKCTKKCLCKCHTWTCHPAFDIVQ